MRRVMALPALRQAFDEVRRQPRPPHQRLRCRHVIRHAVELYPTLRRVLVDCVCGVGVAIARLAHASRIDDASAGQRHALACMPRQQARLFPRWRLVVHQRQVRMPHEAHVAGECGEACSGGLRGDNVFPNRIARAAVGQRHSGGVLPGGKAGEIIASTLAVQRLAAAA